MPTRPLSILCATGVHCDTCRRVDRTGAVWRKGAAAHFDTGAGEAVNFACPAGKPWLGELDPAAEVAALPAAVGPRAEPLDPAHPAYTGFDGSALWAELHTADVLTTDLIDSIAPRLPCGQCRAHWTAMLAATPPPIGEPAPAGQRWVTARHNEVNASLGRRQWTPAESDARWTPTP
jgi:hypothetical protein